MKLIDADLHIHWSDPGEIADRLPRTWHRRFLRGSGHSQRGLPVTQPFSIPPEAGGQPGWTEPNGALTWMDEVGIDTAVLQSYFAPAVSNFGDADYPTLLAEAYNRWLVECWLEQSDRFRGSITVATQDPVAAAAEIRRAGAHSGVVQVLLSAGTLMPYGKRIFRPIFEAAVETGLAVAIHGGTEGVAVSNPPSSHGWPRNLLEYRVSPATNFIAHLTSLITEGTFSDFPELRFVGLEVGGALPLITCLWRFDKNYKALRSECPWVRELPSELVRHHVRLGTQGAAIGNEGLYFQWLGSFGADEILLWSSKQPRWDAIEPAGDLHLRDREGWDAERVRTDARWAGTLGAMRGLPSLSRWDPESDGSGSERRTQPRWGWCSATSDFTVFREVPGRWHRTDLSGLH